MPEIRLGIRATLAGVILALTFPIKPTPLGPGNFKESPPHRMEHGLHLPVAFIVVPVFGFADAGVSRADVTPSVSREPDALAGPGLSRAS